MENRYKMLYLLALHSGLMNDTLENKLILLANAIDEGFEQANEILNALESIIIETLEN